MLVFFSFLQKIHQSPYFFFVFDFYSCLHTLAWIFLIIILNSFEYSHKNYVMTVVINSQLLHQALKFSLYELYPIISYNGLGNSVSFQYVLFEILQNIYCCDFARASTSIHFVK